MKFDDKLLPPRESCRPSVSGCTGPTDDLHPCPYNAEIHGDYEDCCDCCDACTMECAYDI